MSSLSHTVSEFLQQLNPSLWIVTAQHNGDRGGLLATFVNPASIVPDHPRMIVGIAKQHFTHRLVAESKGFALHLMSDMQSDIAITFGMSSGRDIDKFSDVDVEAADTGSPIISSLPHWLDCSVEESMDSGDRTIFLGKVVAAGSPSPHEPLTIHKWISQLDPIQKQRLTEQMGEDVVVDRQRIATWLTKRSISGHVGE